MAEFSPLRDYFLNAQILDISAGGQAYFVVPAAGKIISIQTVIANAITTGDAVLTASINGTAVTGGAITVANAASAAGDVDEAIPTALNDVIRGDAIDVASDNGSTVACICNVTVQIRK